MTWICLDCGNDKTFKGTATDYENRHTEYNAIFDSSGDVEDYCEELGSDIVDSQIEDSEIETCNFCESGDIEDMDDNKIVNWKKEHFDSSGKFSKEIIKLNIDTDGNLTQGD